MISYLIYSTICMGFILLFYYLVLSKEKTYQINRWYLLAGLLFSLVIPLMPFGIPDSLLSTEVPQVLSEGVKQVNTKSILYFSSNPIEQSSATQSQSFEWIHLLLGLYLVVTVVLALRLFRQLYQLQCKSMKNPATFFKGHKVVLTDDGTVPYTFWKTIFLNDKQYQKNKISKEMLTHELVHARQNHTLDILLVEILKTIFWFNPVLYLYKTAIRMNHEYIADQKVLSDGADIVSYQTLLLGMRTAKSNHNLTNSLNFNITKKRFQMMTSNHSSYRSYFKTALVIPFFVILSITFGCDSADMQQNNQMEKIGLEIVDAKTVKLNGKTVPASEFSTAFSDLSIDPDNSIIDLKVHQDVPMGLVTDVQEVLRDNGALRINYSVKQSDESRKTSINRRNILDVHINKEGNIKANQEITSLSSLKKLAKKFITNNGKSAGLSESPEKAIIAIKTDRTTPHDTYENALKEITGVYDELRNQSSMELYNKPYSALEKGSAEENRVKNTYPKRISIKDPAQS